MQVKVDVRDIDENVIWRTGRDVLNIWNFRASRIRVDRQSLHDAAWRYTSCLREDRFVLVLLIIDAERRVY